MRNGPNNKNRMRGRNNRGGGSGGGGSGGGKSHHHHNPLTRVYESNGPEVKIRGTAHHVAEKYLQLARDASSSGDPVTAENFYQHAEHYMRLIAAAQEQFRQQNPSYQPQQAMPSEQSDDDGDGDEQSSMPPQFGGSQPYQQQPREYQQREPQPYQRENQRDYPPRESQNNGQNGQSSNYSRPQHGSNGVNGQQPPQRPQPSYPPAAESSHDALPSFITGGPAGGAAPAVSEEGNAAEGDGSPQGERFGRRRRRGRGPRPEPGASENEGAPQTDLQPTGSDSTND